jgi:dimethylargininase
MWKAITRAVSPSINRCELSYLDRMEIDLVKAREQHQGYEDALRAMGLEVISLPPEPDLPDSVFVEDPAIVLDELAVLARPGAPSRRRETETIASALKPFRKLEFIAAPATLEGGDVMRVERTLYVGASARSNAEGAEQLADILRPFGYAVKRVGISGCLHLKSACTYLGGGIVLANRDWVDIEALDGLGFIDVAPQEPHAANVLTHNGAALLPDCFPATAETVSSLGLKIIPLNISELRKAEAGVTCSSLVFQAA